MGKPLARCMGGRYCSHQPGECTADPAYQAQIAKDRATPPTDDLERRLRETAKARAQMERLALGAYPRPPRQFIEWDAADEIARLRAENEALREALFMAVAEMSRARGRLETIAMCNEDRRIAAALGGTCDFARAALKGPSHE